MDGLRARGVAAPFEDSGGQGLGDASLVSGVGGADGLCALRGDFRGDFDGHGGAGHAVDGGEGGAAEGDGHSCVEEGGVEVAGECQAARDPCGLSGLPGNEARGVGGGERGGEDVDAGAGLRGVQAEAGLGVGVIGELGAAVVADVGVGFAGGEDVDAAGGKQGAEADAEGEGDVLFRLGGAGCVFERAAGVVAAMGRVEDDDEAVGGGGRGLGEGGDGR